MEFDDGYLWVEQWVRDGWLPEASRAPIAALNETLDQMNGERNAPLWTRWALAPASSVVRSTRLGTRRSVDAVLTAAQSLRASRPAG